MSSFLWEQKLKKILLGIFQLLVVWQFAGFDHIVVDAVGLDGIDQLQDG